MSKKDPYLDFLNTDSLLFGTSVGKDPLKFSDPLSFGTSDPLSFGGSDKKQDKKEDKMSSSEKSMYSLGPGKFCANCLGKLAGLKFHETRGLYCTCTECRIQKF